MTFDMYEELPAALRDRAAAWGFIGDFATYWGRPPGPGDGFGADEIGEAGRRLGVPLPVALREAYGLFGRRRDLTANHDRLLGPGELYVAGDVLVYQVENQSCAYWGIRVADLDQADPATVTCPDSWQESPWEPFESSLSRALVGMVMSEVVLLEDGLSDSAELDEEFALESLYRELPSMGPDFRWFTGPDVLIRLIEDEWIDVRGRTEEALDAVREKLPLDWLEG